MFNSWHVKINKTGRKVGWALREFEEAKRAGDEIVAELHAIVNAATAAGRTDATPEEERQVTRLRGALERERMRMVRIKTACNSGTHDLISIFKTPEN